MAETTRLRAETAQPAAIRLTSRGVRGTVGSVVAYCGIGEFKSMSGRVWAWVSAGALAGLMVAGAAGPGRSAGFFEKNFYLSGPRYSADVPLCTESGPLGRIQSHFQTKEGRFWNSDLRIVDFENVREIAFRPWAGGTIPRRFCRAEAIVSDGRKRPIYYSIVEDGGLIGATYGIEWCVVGLDREWAYNSGCKMARP
jgi:hypothetical protein